MSETIRTATAGVQLGMPEEARVGSFQAVPDGGWVNAQVSRAKGRRN